MGKEREKLIWIDLSQKIENNMPVYPGDKEVSIEKVKDYYEDGFNMYVMESQFHSGTHVECPMHLSSSKKYISDFSVERFCGSAVLLDVREESIITLKEEYYKTIKENDIVLLYTGWDSNYGSEKYYYEHPVVSEELAKFLVMKKIKMLGMDIPSPDRDDHLIHKMFLVNEIFILEILKNLNKLIYIDRFDVIALPLNIESEASHTRAIAYYQGY